MVASCDGLGFLINGYKKRRIFFLSLSLFFFFFLYSVTKQNKAKAKQMRTYFLYYQIKICSLSSYSVQIHADNSPFTAKFYSKIENKFPSFKQLLFIELIMEFMNSDNYFIRCNW